MLAFVEKTLSGARRSSFIKAVLQRFASNTSCEHWLMGHIGTTTNLGREQFTVCTMCSCGEITCLVRHDKPWHMLCNQSDTTVVSRALIINDKERNENMTPFSFLLMWKMIWSMTGMQSTPCISGFIASLHNRQFAAQHFWKAWGQTQSCHCPEAQPTWLLGSFCHPRDARLTSCHLKVTADVSFIDARHCFLFYSPFLENTRLMFQRAVSNTFMFQPAVLGCCWTAQHRSRCCFFQTLFKDGTPNNINAFQNKTRPFNSCRKMKMTIKLNSVILMEASCSNVVVDWNRFS